MIPVTLDELREIASDSREELWNAAQSVGHENPLVILHWSAGHHDTLFSDYHVNVRGDGKIYVSTTDFSEVLEHTWRLNTGTVGVALCCAYGADTNDLGDEPPTDAQIEIAAQVIAALCEELWISCTPDNVLTHGEAADDNRLYDDEDLYGPKNGCERWDLEYLGTPESPVYDPWCYGRRGGDVLRGKANWYQEYWKNDR